MHARTGSAGRAQHLSTPKRRLPRDDAALARRLNGQELAVTVTSVSVVVVHPTATSALATSTLSTITVTTVVPASATGTSSLASSASALTSSTTPLAPSTTSSTTATATTSSTSTSSTAANPTSSAPPTTTSLPIPSTSAVTTSIPPSASASAVGSSSDVSTGKGVPAAAIAVPVVLGILALLAVNFFWIRKRYIRNREAKRGTWGAGIYPFTAQADEYHAPPPVTGSSFGPYGQSSGGAEMQQSSPAGYEGAAYGGGSTYGGGSMYGRDSAYGGVAPMSAPRVPQPPVVVQPPPMSYNNPTMLPITPIPTSLTPGKALAPAAAPRSGSATVRCTFIPSLPDELSISMGERVNLLAEYDDGWGFCENAAGAQGMVPLECLDKGDGTLGTLSPSTAGDGRQNRRASSLKPDTYRM